MITERKYDTFLSKDSHNNAKIMIQVKNILGQIGLSDKEARVYLALLELEYTTVQWIAKKTDLNRTTIYDIVESLKQKGLVSFYVKNKVKYFVSAPPEKVADMLEEKLEREQRIFRNLKDLLPELNAMYNSKKIKPRVQFFESSEALEEVYMKMYGEGGAEESCFEYASWANHADIYPKDMRRRMLEYRKEHNIFTRQIAVESEYTKSWVTPEYQKNRFKEIRLIRDTGFDFGANIEMYDNKIVITMFGRETGLTGFYIESRELYKMLRTAFECMWQCAK